MRKSRLTVLAAIMIAACSWGGISFAQEKVELRLRLEKGQKFEQIVAIQQKMSQTIESRYRIDLIGNTRMSLQTEVVNIEANGDYQLTTTYKTVKSDVTAAQIGLNDSMLDTIVNSYKESYKRHAAKYSGHSFTYNITPQGKITEIKGADALAKHSANSLPLDANTQKEFAQYLEKTVKEQGARGIHFAALPAEPVDIGDSWLSNTSAKSSDDLTSHLTARENNTAVITSRAKEIGYPANQFTLNSPEAKNISFDLSGNANTITRVDENTGWPREYESHERLSGQFVMTISIPEQPANDSEITYITFSWPVYVKTTIRGWTITPPR